MWLPAKTEYQAGDVAFYADHGSLIDKAIVLRTGSTFVHVAVFVSPTETIAATSAGITRQAHGNEVVVWRPRAGYAAMRQLRALAFLDGEVGKPYGYADIINQLLLLKGGDPVLLDKSSDCSDLATKFLWIAGTPLPAALILTDRVTPGGLHDALNEIV